MKRTGRLTEEIDIGEEDRQHVPINLKMLTINRRK